MALGEAFSGPAAVARRSGRSFRTTGLACAAGLVLTFAAACGSGSAAGSGTNGGSAASGPGTSGSAASGSGTSGSRASSAAAAPTCTAAADSVCMIFGSSPVAHGLTQEQTGGTTGDSEYHAATVGGRPAFVFDANSADPNNPVSYVYFQVDPSSALVTGSPSTLYMTVTYYDDPAGGELYAEYDSTDSSAPVNGAYKSVATHVKTGGTKAWKSITWSMPQVNFQQQENGSSDFRLDGSAGVAVGSVVISQKPPAGVKAP